MPKHEPIPRDLSKVKTKILFNLTKRQLVCFGLGALAGVPVFFISRHFGVDVSSAVMRMMYVMVPFFLFAMYEKNGQPLEKVLRYRFRAVFIRPKVRPYRTLNYYSCLARQAKAREEIAQIVSKRTLQDKEKNRTHTSAGTHKGRAEAGARNHKERRQAK